MNPSTERLNALFRMLPTAPANLLLVADPEYDGDDARYWVTKGYAVSVVYLNTGTPVNLPPARPDGFLRFIACDVADLAGDGFAEGCYDAAIVLRPFRNGAELTHLLQWVGWRLSENGRLVVADHLPSEDSRERHPDWFCRPALIKAAANNFLYPVRKVSLQDQVPFWMMKKSGVRVKSYDPGDEDRILPLFNRIFHQQRTPADWNWKFKENPYGMLMASQAVDKAGEVVAHLGAYPVQFYSTGVNPTIFRALQVGDIMTRPSHRALGRGPTSLLSRVAIYFYNVHGVDQVPFVYGYVTGHSRLFGERFLGYECLPRIVMRVLYPYRLKQPNWLRQRFSGIRIRQLRQPDEALDALFRRVRDHYGTLVVRSADYVRWRYFERPDQRYTLFGVYRFKRLIGWGAFKCRDKTLIWGDGLFDRRYLQAVGLLMIFVMQHAFPQATRLLSWVSPQPAWWAALLDGLGFESEPEPNGIAPTFTFFDSRLSLSFLHDTYYYTMGDSDLF